MNKILYTPVDIDFEMPTEEEIQAYFDEHKMTDTTYSEFVNGRHIWCTVATRGEPRDWYHFDCFSEHWGNSRKYIEGAELVFHPEFEKKFPSLVELIKQQPFKQIGGVAIIQQIGTVPDHNDTDDFYNPTEPRRYLTYLTNPDYNTFYILDGNEKRFPQIDNKYRCFAFNNSDVQHGADWHGKTKLLLTTAGVIDNEKHEELIKRSVEKFKDKVMYANI